MDPASLGIIFAVLLLIFIFLFEIPIGFAMALAGAMGIFFISGTSPLLNLLSHIPYTVSSNYTFTTIPMFVLMGWLAAEGGISTDIFTVMNKWLGWLRGGLAMAVSMACAAFGAVCGDVITAAITMTTISLPEMRRHNYSDRLATGVLAAGGNLSFLIPPSILFIIYGITTETPIGPLFIAGILPGILMALLFCVAVYIVCRINPTAGPASPRVPLREMLRIPSGAWLMILLVIVVLGGIYAGVCTPTEAGGIGAFATLVFGLAARRYTQRKLVNALVDTIKTSGMIFILIIGANIFKAMMALSTLPFMMVEAIEGFATSPWLILIAILVLYVILGFALDVVAILLITLPIVFPMIVALGFDPVWFGVLALITVLMGQISPPFGILVFAVGGMVRDVPVMTIFKGAMPFLIATAITLAIIVAFPQIALLLPGLMR